MPPSSGGLCEGVMTMPSAKPAAPASVVGEDGVGDDRGRGIATILVHHDLDAVGGQHLQDAGKGWLRIGHAYPCPDREGR